MKRTFEKMILALILLGLIFACAHSKSMQIEADRAVNPLSLMIRFYRGPLNHLSAVRHGECPMYPSDSEYGLQSLQKHGMLVGWIMAMDRLMRCGRDETRLSPKVFINGKWKYYDPVGKNDFWWRDR
ncbi:MAG: membrane protein insertion efficiency factor YidD [Proteobacteria bacterium]|nr:membrane protein insertion efficiency factor YidD [Pseudomonadota bacterium]